MQHAGPGNCVGRTLAKTEMRAVLAALVRRFDVRFADGFQPASWEEALEDQYILTCGTLPVVMTKRA
jgi:cytochrome P450